MANETVVSDSSDPLNGLNGPSLFPRTIRASSDGSLPADFKNLDSIHIFMKSLELRSPEGLMPEAKIIMDGGTELLESSLVSFAEKVDITDDVATKCKDGPKERRPGLGRARKKGSFSLKNSFCQSMESLKPILNIDELQDPDDYFDAMEREENANKEIQKQLGGSMETSNKYNQITNTRRRRPSILGKSYNMKHRYSSAPCENDDLLASSLAREDELIDPEFDSEEPEFGVSTKKSDGDVGDINKVLSRKNEDLEGDGALKLLQEQFNIKPLLHIQNLHIHNSGRTNIFNAEDSVLKNMNTKSSMGYEERAKNKFNTNSSPTPLRSPLSLLKKKISQINHPNDPFPIVNNFSGRPASPAQPTDKIQKQVDAQEDLSMPGDLKSCVEVDSTKPTIPNMDAQVLGYEDSPYQVHEDAILKRADSDNRANEVPENTEETMNTENSNDKNLMNINDNVAPDDSSSRQQFDAEQQSEVSQPKVQREKIKVGVECTRKELLKKKIHAAEATDDSSHQREDDSIHEPSKRIRVDPERQPEVDQVTPQRRKREVVEKRIRKAHPMRKSIAEAGTSFEAGVRRSKRIRMRPLEFWKGERFLYGRMDDSLKLLGVKYLSPGTGNRDLKVKPYLSTESSEFKELLQFVSRH